MRHILISKLLFASFLISTLSGCGPGEGDKNLASNPVKVAGELNVIVNEDEGLISIDLLAGVTNSEESDVKAVNLTYMRQNEDGSNAFIGPALPAGSLFLDGNEAIFDSNLWHDLLVHRVTAEQDSELFHQGIYDFTYSLDNGSTTLVERTLKLTVNGIEDKVEEIIVNENVIDVLVIAPVTISASVLPESATFKGLIWSVLDESIATVSANGLVTGIKEGTTQVLITSADGLITTSVNVNVIPAPTEPVGIDILINDESIASAINPIAINRSLQLTSAFLPLGVEFDNEVEWSSSEPRAITVDAEGLITVITLNEGTVTITAKIKNMALNQTAVFEILPPQNMLTDEAANFEGVSDVSVHWEVLNGTLTTLSSGGVDGSVGLQLETIGTARSIVKTKVTSLTPEQFNPNKDYLLTFDFKKISNNDSFIGGFPGVVDSSGTKSRSNKRDGNASKKYGTKAVGEWNSASVIFKGQRLNRLDPAITGQIAVNLEQDVGQTFVYDNFNLKVILP